MLPGVHNGELRLCRDCAGITTALTCVTCGREAERIRGGNCVKCVLRGEMEDLLRPNDPPDLRLRRLIEEFVNAGRPASVLTWSRGRQARALLEQIGARTLRLDHESFDDLPASNAVEHLRELLVHHRVLPYRGDRALVRFEQWVEQRVIDLAETPDVAQLIDQYARWHHLKRLRTPDPARDLTTAALTARQEITEAGKFLVWLRSEHDLPPDGVRQGHVDEYIAGGTSTRKHVRHFLHWFSKAGQLETGVSTPRRNAMTTPLLTEEQRIQLVANCIAFQQVRLSTRVAGIIHLLWAQPINKIRNLRIDAVEMTAEGIFLRLGDTASLVPGTVAELFTTYLQQEREPGTLNSGTDWLFPGGRAGHPIGADNLSKQLRVLGIDPQRARNTVLRDLTSGGLNVGSLADLIGYSPKVIATHAAMAGAFMSDVVDTMRSSRE